MNLNGKKYVSKNLSEVELELMLNKQNTVANKALLSTYRNQ